MPNICAGGSAGSNNYVSAALFAASPSLTIGDVLYHLASPNAKTQCCYHRDDGISLTTGTGTTFELPNIYREVIGSNNANYGGNIYPSCSIPSGL